MSYSVHANIVHSDGLRARKLLDAIEEAIRYETVKPEWIETGMFPAYVSTGMSEVSDAVAEHPGFVDETWHDENTLFKVLDAIEEYGYTRDSAMGIIQGLQNAGILFRERVPD